ncbi:hypothetical protein ABZ815_20025 [Nonomuraea sp. NPDC047529]|uniref:hypothetical protein n=1 Tax=Nonomuraea sp. NPDC047529 TaxID=3155623 RepID=UPI0033DD6730
MIANPFQDVATPRPTGGAMAGVAEDALAIWTQMESGVVGLRINWSLASPTMSASSWERYEDVELVTTTGVMQIREAVDIEAQPNITFQGAGRYGVRVYGRRMKLQEGVGTREPSESYMLTVWPIETVAHR